MGWTVVSVRLLPRMATYDFRLGENRLISMPLSDSDSSRASITSGQVVGVDLVVPIVDDVDHAAVGPDTARVGVEGVEIVFGDQFASSRL